MNNLTSNCEFDLAEGEVLIPAEITKSIRSLIRWAGDDPDREGLANTPQRVAHAWREVEISELARVLLGYAQRLQVQERPTAQVAGSIWDNLKPQGMTVAWMLPGQSGQPQGSFVFDEQLLS